MYNNPTEALYTASYCLSDVLNFTRYFFREKEKKRFVVGRHHRMIADKLNDVLRGKCRRLIINIAPRHGKTSMAVHNFIAMGLAVNPRAKFLHLSYSSSLAQANSVEIKDIINSDEYRRLFPGTSVRYGSDTKSQWDTEAGGGVYATSTLGQITGFGAGLTREDGEEYVFGGAIVIDDPLKPEDAFSELEREKVNRRFETTIRNRLNNKETPIIIIMQRLHEHDLCGYLQEIEPDEWEVLSIPAVEYDEEGNAEALFPLVMPLEMLMKYKEASPIVFETQYMQNPTPLEGLMYGTFKTYDTLPITKTRIRKNATDTADTGADFLCSINYIETEIGNFVIDVLYTDKPMEYTEPMVASMLHRDNINVANIESNNGGRGFARNVEAQTRILGNNTTKVEWFHQTANKQVRIFSRSNEVTNLTYFPSDWERRWAAFARHVKGYRKDGKELHDDGVDCLTMTIELRGKHDNEMNYYKEKQEGARILFVMPDNEGKFIMLDCVVNEYINVERVAYRAGFEPDAMREWANGADDVVLESDKAFFPVGRDLREEGTDVRMMHKNTNPMLRMSAQRAFIREKVRYRSDYDEYPEYTAFMDAVLDEENCFEAMDAVSAMCVYVRKKWFER